jgi:hypothetical protein
VEIITEDSVTETAIEISEFSHERAHSEMTSLANIQPNLVAFMVEFTQDLDQEVSALALFWFFNVCRMFKQAYRKPLKQISHETIVECYESNEALIDSLENTHDRFIERIASIQLSDQPYVMQYVVESLFEPVDEKEGLELSEEDTGYLFLLLKTVVDALQIATPSHI